jgi:dolichol kinase
MITHLKTSRAYLYFCIVLAPAVSTIVAGAAWRLLPFKVAASTLSIVIVLFLCSRLLMGKRIDALLPGRVARIKVSHIGGGTMLCLMGGLHGLDAVRIIAVACLISYELYECFRWIAQVQVPFIAEALTVIGTPEELEAKPFLSPIYGLTGIVLVSTFFPAQIACASIAVLALGDGVAGLVGRIAGKHPLRTGKRKSMEGSLAGLAASFIGCLLLVPIELAFAGALVGIIAEMLSTSLDDNLAVPLASALAMTLTKTFLPL